MICCHLNILSLVVELDAKIIVDVLGNSDYVNNVISPILDDCRLLASYFQQIQFKHYYRQANHYTDSRVRMSFSKNFEFTYFESLPMYINGMYSNGLCYIVS